MWFGRFGEDANGQADRSAFETIAQGCPLGRGLPLPPWPASLSCQLSVTMQDVFQEPQLRERGIVVMDDGNVSHLTAFWNLRACGQEIFPWTEARADLLEEPLRQWLDETASAPAGAPGLLPGLPVWFPPGENVPPPLPPRLSALVGTSRFRLMPQPQHVDPHACGPLMTSHVRRFSADTGRAGEAVITLPGPRFPATPAVLD